MRRNETENCMILLNQVFRKCWAVPVSRVTPVVKFPENPSTAVTYDMIFPVIELGICRPAQHWYVFLLSLPSSTYKCLFRLFMIFKSLLSFLLIYIPFPYSTWWLTLWYAYQCDPSAVIAIPVHTQFSLQITRTTSRTWPRFTRRVTHVKQERKRIPFWIVSHCFSCSVEVDVVDLSFLRICPSFFFWV